MTAFHVRGELGRFMQHDAPRRHPWDSVKPLWPAIAGSGTTQGGLWR
jgi:hypothetical protein